MGRRLLGSASSCLCILFLVDGAALRQEIRNSTPNETSGRPAAAHVFEEGLFSMIAKPRKSRSEGLAPGRTSTGPKTTKKKNGNMKEDATMDIVLVHCKESYDLAEGGDGQGSGFSPVVWAAGSAENRLRVRRSIVYTKCATPLRVGPAFTVVNMSTRTPGKSLEREESGYI